MKYLLIIIVFIASYTDANSQTEEGSRMVGGSLDLDLAFDDDDDAFEFLFTPRYGIFVKNGLAVGGEIGIRYEKTGDDNTETDIAFGPFARWYILGGETLKMLLQAEAGYLYSRNKIGGSSATEHGFQFFGGPGMSYFISDNVSLDVILGYNYRTFGDDAVSSNLKLLAGFQIFF
jgi:hypothetical protein